MTITKKQIADYCKFDIDNPYSNILSDEGRKYMIILQFAKSIGILIE